MGPIPRDPDIASATVSREVCEDRRDALQRYLEAKLDAILLLVEERFARQQEALTLKSGSLDRHLSLLNNAHERADRVLEKIIGREVYEVDRQRNAADHDEFKQALTVIQTRTATLMSVWGIVLIVLNIAIGIAVHFL
jgi:hypothetical protein